MAPIQQWCILNVAPIHLAPIVDHYVVTADGQRFLVKTRVEEDDRRIHAILNWTSLME